MLEKDFIIKREIAISFTSNKNSLHTCQFAWCNPKQLTFQGLDKGSNF